MGEKLSTSDLAFLPDWENATTPAEKNSLVQHTLHHYQKYDPDMTDEDLVIHLMGILRRYHCPFIDKVEIEISQEQDEKHIHTFISE